MKAAHSADDSAVDLVEQLAGTTAVQKAVASVVLSAAMTAVCWVVGSVDCLVAEIVEQ